MPYYWTPYPYPHYYWAQYGPQYAPVAPYSGPQGSYYAPVTPSWSQQGSYATPGVRSDAEIGTDVVNAMRNDTWVDSSNIAVAVNNGVVTLTGTVPNLFQKRQAGDDAWDVPGVVDVQNNLITTGS
jgi:hypothetical protein